MLTTRGIYTLSSLTILFSISWLLSDLLFITALLTLILTLSLEGIWFQWSLRNLRELEVECVAERDRVFARETWEVAVKIKSRYSSIPPLIEVWLPVPDSFQTLSEDPPTLKGLKRGGETTLRYIFKPLEPGDYQVEALLLRIYDPSLLFWSEEIIHQSLRVKVLPRIPSSKVAEALDIYPIPSSSMRALMGKGKGMEFEGIRQYVPGDDFRHIAWKATAKSPTHELMTKELEDKGLRRIILAVPSYTGMGDGRVGERKIDRVVEAALGIAYAAVSSGDKVAILYQGGRDFTFTPWLSHKEQLYMAVEALYNLEPRGSMALDSLVDRILGLGGKALIFLFLDVSYPKRLGIEEISGLRVLGHSIHLFLLDNRRFLGVDWRGDEAVDLLLEMEGEHLSHIVTSCIKAGIPYSICGPGDLLEEGLKIYGEWVELMVLG